MDLGTPPAAWRVPTGAEWVGLFPRWVVYLTECGHALVDVPSHVLAPMLELEETPTVHCPVCLTGRSWVLRPLYGIN